MFLSMMEWAVIFMFILLMITQVFIPAIRGTVLFPLFKKSIKLEAKLAETNQTEMEIDLENQIKKQQTINEKKKEQEQTKTKGEQRNEKRGRQ